MVLILSYININNKAVLDNVNLAQFIMNKHSFLFQINICVKVRLFYLESALLLRIKF